jgi:hypothetical protein
MVGVDVSLRPWAWAAPGSGRWAFGELPDGGDPARALREALASSRARDRAVALCIPARSVVWDTIPGLRLRSRQARKAATLAAATRLRVTPRDAVVSLGAARDGVMYVGAERVAIEAAMAPWLAAGFTVPVVEPAAVSLLRAIGSEAPVAIVRTGAGEVEIVAGSRDRLLFARRLPVALEAGQANAVRLEVDATIDAARKDGVAIERVLVSGRGDLDALVAAFPGSAGVAALSPERRVPEAPSWAIAAASAALWRASAPPAKRPARGAGALLGRLLGIGARRPRGAGEDHAA